MLVWGFSSHDATGRLQHIRRLERGQLPRSETHDPASGCTELLQLNDREAGVNTLTGNTLRTDQSSKKMLLLKILAEEG